MHHNSEHMHTQLQHHAPRIAGILLKNTFAGRRRKHARGKKTGINVQAHKKVFFATPQFWSHVQEGQYEGANQTQYADIFTCSKCSTRDCQHRRTASCHASTSIDLDAKRISWSSSSRFNHQAESNTLYQWLQREHASSADPNNTEITNWSVDSGPSPRTSMPSQENSYDCGVFVCLYDAHIAIQKPFTFTQAHINDVRLWFVELT